MRYYVTFFQGFLIAVTAQFIPLLVYQYRDPAPEVRMSSPAYREDNLQRSLGGYVNYSLSEFPISALIFDDANPFPLASAIALKYYIGDKETDFFYQPYHTNTTCFEMSFPNFTFTDAFPSEDSEDSEDLPYFRESVWDSFTNLYSIDPGGEDHDLYLDCVNIDFKCK